jgi:glutaredoxin-like protein NrdH
MQTTKVEGKNNKHKVMLYALSTCGWCRKCKELLRANNIEFEYVDVDLCSDEDYEKIRQEITSRGGRFSFPTVIIDDTIVITGFKEDKIRESLEM